MTANPVSIEPTASVMKAARLMMQHRVGGLPVVAASGTLVGVITRSDLLHQPETGKRRSDRMPWLEFLIGPGPLAPKYAQACRRKVYEVMSPEVFTAREDTSVGDIVRIMQRRQVKRLPVLRGERLVGIVGRKDILGVISKREKTRTRADARQSVSRLQEARK
jgi:CBS domain-containing protein